MTAAALRDAINCGKPFRLRSSDGAVVDVPTRDHAFLNPTGRLVIVFTDDDGARLLDVARITALIAGLMSVSYIRARSLKMHEEVPPRNSAQAGSLVALNRHCCELLQPLANCGMFEKGQALVTAASSCLNLNGQEPSRSENP